MSRSRFSGSAADVVTAIEPFVKSAGWLQYGDDLQASKVNSKEILRHKSLIGTLAKLHDGLSFKKCTITAAFTSIGKSHFKRLDIDEADIQQWAKDMDLRLRCMLRHVAQARAKPTPPSWVGVVLGLPEAPGRDDEPGTAPDTGAGPVDFFYGWDSEHHAAWRQPVDGKGSKELTKDIFCKDGSDDMSPMWARWPDGTEHVLSELLKSTWDSMQATADAMQKRGRGAGRDPVPRIWSGNHVSSGAELWVARRTDRQLLTSIYEAGKQIMQVSSSQVVGNMEQADLIAVEMAKQYASGTVDRAGLKPLKMALLLKAGFRAAAAEGSAAGSKPAARAKAKASAVPAAAGPRKRPAAAEADAPAAAPAAASAGAPAAGRPAKRPAAASTAAAPEPSPTEDAEGEAEAEGEAVHEAIAFLDDGGPPESVFDIWN